MSEKILTTRVVTDRVFLNFPHLVKPQEQKNSKYGSAPRYGATIIIPKEDETTLNKIRAAINNAIEIGGFNVNDNIKNPLKDGDVVYPGEELFLNSMFINASTPIQKNYAYIFCFYGNCFNEKNVVAPKAIDSDYNILFFNVTYEAAIVILKDIGFSKIKEDSVDFGVIFEEDLQHNMLQFIESTGNVSGNKLWAV